MLGVWPTPFDPEACEESSGGGRAFGRTGCCPGQSVWPVWLSSDHGVIAERRLESQS
jgi:hypothetical protein